MNQPTTALDWATIRRDCPKAFVILMPWVLEHLPHERLEVVFCDDDHFCKMPANPRDLYDFFDGQGVYLCVDGRKDSWRWTIYDHWSTVTHPLPTRPAAETAGFTAAFGVLEGMLNQQRG